MDLPGTIDADMVPNKFGINQHCLMPHPFKQLILKCNLTSLLSLALRNQRRAQTNYFQKVYCKVKT